MNCRVLILFALMLALGSYAIGQNQLRYSSYADMEKEILADKENITILNFWATWCKPCVAEIPDFEKMRTDFGPKGVKIILANLDFHSKADSLVSAFIKNRNIQSHVVHITDQDPNDWIDRVDASWTGSIPVTAVYHKGEKIWFHEGVTDYETLKSIINKYIQ